MTTARVRPEEVSMALKQELLTGGDVGLSVNTNVFDTNSTRVDVNPAYTPGVAVEFRQPLLRNSTVRVRRAKARPRHRRAHHIVP